MKHPVYWFLVSSSLLASTSLGFAQAQEETLTSADSYNGNTAGDQEFTPKETSAPQGTTYTCTGNICISYAGLSNSGLTNSCFTDTAGNLAFVGNGYTLCFDNITTAASNPGAINVQGDQKTLGISGFSLFSCAHCPPGTNGYGAIQTKGTTTLKDNSSLVFHKNCSTTDGGAIRCTASSAVELKMENNQNLVFSENSSTSSGGAIYADKLTIVSGGPTLFSNNSVSKNASPKGGAICLKDSGGECSLTANLGDIIFDGNKIITTARDSSTVKRNSIDLGSSGKFTKLDAKEGFGIFFYDPIANTGDTETALELNKTANSTNYTGKIVFSGEKLSDAEKQDADNLKSYFKQPITLSAGSLVLKDGVTLEAKKVTQTAGSNVVMDLGTTLQTPATGGETITLTNLDINVASLGGGGSLQLLLKSQQLQKAKQLQSVLSI
ncbi:chlamydia polymorphic membrane family protein [Chlamydia psittaci WC]|uniref:polymorphic outer membrane protein middle domain-containing protein n=1 Tax=Chlamydia psittaci TaxID=83554 RepID=UPI00027E12CC|nr:polymorphic outer membrane protein middle domain-containing protein [Chlamydia psittaci]AFS25971.1 chlamydia polymorphic membrane family protein [Chlamydia psittaci WC]